jgi:hypothetical protein
VESEKDHSLILYISVANDKIQVHDDKLVGGDLLQLWDIVYIKVAANISAWNVNYQ